MAWAKKELPKYPPLGFTLGEFIRDKSVMNEEKTVVKNSLYYTNCKIQVDYYYSDKSRTFESNGSVYTEMKEKDVLWEIAKIEDEERENEKAKEEEQIEV